MKGSYRIIDSENNVEIALRLPAKMIRDLAIRAEENGHEINTDVMIRLARSLERDREALAADRLMASTFMWEPEHRS